MDIFAYSRDADEDGAFQGSLSHEGSFVHGVCHGDGLCRRLYLVRYETIQMTHGRRAIGSKQGTSLEMVSVLDMAI